MDELSLYKFITKNNVEYRWADDEDVLLMINNSDLDEFSKLLTASILEAVSLKSSANSFLYES